MKITFRYCLMGSCLTVLQSRLTTGVPAHATSTTIHRNLRQDNSVGDLPSARQDSVKVHDPFKHRELSNTCGNSCTSNGDCQTSDTTCNYCDGFECYNPYKCNRYCTSDLDCNFSLDGCTSCSTQGICVGSGGSSICVDNEKTLRGLLLNSDSDLIQICGDTAIEVVQDGALLSLRSDVTVECLGGTCELVREGTGRILYVDGNNITLRGLTFRNGYDTSNGGGGGAVYITGTGNQIEDCAFVNNTTPLGMGGAVNMGNGSVVRCAGYDNSAKDCSTVRVRNADQCIPFDGSYRSQCGMFCQSDSDCGYASGTCTTCNLSNNKCGYPVTCVSSESALNSILQDEQTLNVQICKGSTITVTEEISTSVSGKSLFCEGGNGNNCAIVQQGTGRILSFSGNNILISGIRFSNGSVSGKNGGALYLAGTGNNITSCEFTSNSAQGGKGGAVYIYSGTIEDTSGSGNIASQCADAYLGSSGSCMSFSS